MLRDIIDLVNVLQNFNPSTTTIIFMLLIVCCVVCWSIFEDRRHKKYYDDMKNEKNKEIERLADDNRRYRDIYLKSKDIEQSEINNLTAYEIKGE